MGSENQKIPYWVRTSMDRSCIIIRFESQSVPKNPSVLNSFYELARVQCGHALPRHVDYYRNGSGASNELRLVFSDPIQAECFHQRLRPADYRTLGVSSIRWVDLRASQMSLDNSNVSYYTRQLPNSVEKYDTLMGERRGDSSRDEDPFKTRLERAAAVAAGHATPPHVPSPFKTGRLEETETIQSKRAHVEETIGNRNATHSTLPHSRPSPDAPSPFSWLAKSLFGGVSTAVESGNGSIEGTQAGDSIATSSTTMMTTVASAPTKQHTGGDSPTLNESMIRGRISVLAKQVAAQSRTNQDLSVVKGEIKELHELKALLRLAATLGGDFDEAAAILKMTDSEE